MSESGGATDPRPAVPAAIAALVLVVSAAVASVVTWSATMSLPVPGVYFDHAARVNLPMPEAAAEAGITTNYHLIALDGEPVTSGVDAVERLRSRTSRDPIRAALRAPSGRVVELVSEGQTPPVLRAAVMRLVGIAFAVFAALILIGHPRDRRAWLFAAFCLPVALSLAIGSTTPRAAVPVWLSALNAAMLPLGGVFGLHFVSVFPRPLLVVIRHPRVPWIVDGIAVAGGCALFVLGLDPGFAVRVGTWISLCTNALCAALAIAILVWRGRKPMPAIDRAALRLLVVGATAALAPVVAINVLTVTRAWTPPESGPQILASLTLAAFPASVAYAMWRWRMLEFDRVAARATSYFAATGLIGLIYLTAGVAVPAAWLDRGDSTPAAAAAAVVVLVALWPLRKKLEAILRARLSRSRLFDAVEELAAALSERRQLAAAGDFAEVERHVQRTFSVRDAAIFVRGESAWRRPASGATIDEPTGTAVAPVRVDGREIGAVALSGDGDADNLAAVANSLAKGLAPLLPDADAPEEIGGYRVERFLAAGGMGAVYLATRTGPGGFARRVAIKRLLRRAKRSRDEIDRFLAEARIAARLEHPNIVQTLELDEDDRGLYIVMEYVDGVDAARLAHALRASDDRLPPELAATIVMQACLALHHAHEAGDADGRPMRLVHHDVSPHNILISTAGAVKLADFGVASAVELPRDPGELVGKIGYWAPEQLEPGPLDHRVDVFAAGIVLYELITGEHPFYEQHDARATWDNNRRVQYMPLAMLAPEAPAELARIAARAMHAEPDDRYQTARELADALEAIYPYRARYGERLGQLATEHRAVDGDAHEAPETETMNLRAGRSP